MAGALRKTMEYLGLAEGEAYASHPHGVRGGKDDGFGELDGEWDAVDDHEDYGHPGGSTRVPRGSDADAGHDDDHAQESEHERRGYGRVTTLHPRSGSLVRPPEVRHEEAEEEVPDLRRITTIHPRTYNEAKSIGESFRGGIPVIMNLTDMSDADAKRLVDFSAGLVFGLRGSIERVTNKVFLLSPEHVTVTGEAAPPRPARLFNQS